MSVHYDNDDSTGATQEVANMQLTETAMDTSTVVPPPGLAPTTTPMNNHAINLPRELQEHLEQLVLDDSDLMVAFRQVHANLPQPNLNEVAKADDETIVGHLKNFLLACAFSFNSPSPYGVLGFSELDGPMPTRTSLERRREFAEKVVLHWANPRTQAALDGLLQPINQACDRCTEQLHDMEKKRKTIKGVTKNTPHWMELGPEVLEFVCAYIPNGAVRPPKVATQLSNVLRQDTSHLNNLASIAQARELYSQLNSQPQVIEDVLGRLTDPILTWAPEAPSQTLKIAAKFMEMQAQNRGPGQLSLMTTFDAYPGCTTAEHILDIWQYPLMGNKWRDLVTTTSLVHPPALVIVSGQNAPMHVRKGLAIFTLATAHTPAIPTLLPWIGNFFTHNTAQTIWVDMPHHYRWQVHGMIESFQLPGLIAADRPKPSLANRASDQWSSIKLHFNENVGSPLMQDVVVTWLRKNLDCFKAVVGLQSTIAKKDSKLLELAAPMGAYLLGNLSQSCLLVSPRLAIVETSVENNTWAANLTRIWNVDPANSGLKLSLRDSSMARSKKCAEVAATREQIQGARCRGGHAEIQPSRGKPETLRAFIDIPVAAEAQLDKWLPSLMDSIAHVSAVPLARHLEPVGMALGSWQPIMNFEGSWTGRVAVQCNSKEELYKLHRTIHNKGITIQGHTTTASIYSHYVDLANQL